MVDYVETFDCPTCRTKASGRGHLCHPNPAAAPFVCEYCGKETSNQRHACKKMVDKIEYACRKCGRLAAYASMLCEPENISGD